MKIAVTRPRSEAGALVERLERLGHEVLVCPLIEIAPVGPEEIEVAGYDWVVVTSRVGARELARRYEGALPRVAAIGPGTAETLREHGIEPALVASVSTQEGLVAAFPRPSGRVLFAGAEDARRFLIDELHADFVPLYRTRILRPPAFPEADVVVLASASAARAFGALGLDIPAISIGPQTTRVALAAGVRVLAEARRHDADGLAAAVAELEERPLPSSA